jgi:N-acylneuraminate cytidylyltransferase
MENGAFYITDKKILEQTECRLGGNIGFYEMSSETATEIDEESDWEMVSNLLKKRHNLS